MIFWLSHKENEGDNQVKLTLDRRRISVGQKVELTVTAATPRAQPRPASRTRPRSSARAPNATPEPVELYTQGDEWRGLVPRDRPARRLQGHRVARKNGQEIGRDSARFLVYQDDRELENPSADLALARQIAEITGGEAVPHESWASTSRASTSPPTPSTSARPSTGSGTTGRSS